MLFTAPCLPPLAPWWGQGGAPCCCWGMVGAPAVQEAASDTAPAGRGICYWWVGWCQASHVCLLTSWKGSLLWADGDAQLSLTPPVGSLQAFF